MRNFCITILPTVLMALLTPGLSQLPVEINHPSQILIKRYSALGKLPLENFGNNSINAQVFRRDGFECYRCREIIVKIKLGGRGTHYCPSCQK